MSIISTISTTPRRGFDTFYGSYLGVLDHWAHTRTKYGGYDWRRQEEVDFSASGEYSTHLYTRYSTVQYSTHLYTR